jgi:hypothetical protein
MSRFVARIVSAAGVLALALCFGEPARAAAIDDVRIVYVTNPIPLNVDAYLVNSGSRTVLAVVHAEHYRGSMRISADDKVHVVPPHDKVYLGKARDSLEETRFSLKAASYK